jgi:hypothetical protein
MKNLKISSSLIILGLFIFFTQSCRKAASEIPFYFKCDSATVTPGGFGIANTGIYGLYVSVESDVRGRWQLPFNMPILKDGLKTMVVTPMVKVNNLSTRFIDYPLLSSKLLGVNMVRGNFLDTILSFDYATGVSLILNDDMESTLNFSASTKSSVARNGSFSMLLQADFTSVDSSATSFFNKPLAFNFEKTTFLEFDYYMPEGILAPALAYTDASGNTRLMFGESYLNKNSNWTHVYFNYTYIIDRIGKTGLFTPVFIITPPKGSSASRAYIDNVRILEK